MHEAEYTALRRHLHSRQIIDEFAVRFVYTGEGLQNAPVQAGDLAELKRVRILQLESSAIVEETWLENWTVLFRRPAGTRP